MQQIAVMVGENLHFNMASTRKKFFQENCGIAEGGARLTLRFFQPGVELRSIVHHAHTAPAAAHGGLHDYWIADFARNFLRFGR